jgi:hypothetical protein
MRNLYIATGILAAGFAGRYAYSPGSAPTNSKTGAGADASAVTTGQASVEGPLKILCRGQSSKGEECELNFPFQGEFRVAGKGKRAPAALRNALQQSLLDMSEHMITELKSKYWSRGGSQTLKETEAEEDTKDALKTTRQDADRDKIDLLFQEFVAMRFSPISATS